MIKKIRNILSEKNLDAILVNSTNEYLVEYNSLEENSRYKLTAFTGSTGDAIVTKDEILLFVDGRYHIQAENEVDKNFVTVVKLQQGETFLGKLKEIFPKNARLGLNPAKNSVARYESLCENFRVTLLPEFDAPRQNQNCKESSAVNIPIELSGKSSNQKIKEVSENLSPEDAILITNLEEVSYLLNKRDFSRNYSSKVELRAIVTKNSAKTFSREDFELYKNCLNDIKGNVFADKNSLNVRDYEIIKNKIKFLDNSPLKLMKSIKTDAEISHYIEAFSQTDKALRAVREFISNNDNLSEKDIDLELEKQFKIFGAKNLSFKSIIAKDKNSASAHYSKSSPDEILTDGSLVLIDCGAYYAGGLATDITRVFVKGNPTELQKKVYTTVLKAFLLGYGTKLEETTSGFEIDKKVREYLCENKIGDFVFNHGLGHGIGVSVHEAPPNLSPAEFAKVKLQENMCFTIEPGLYDKNNFGIRLENSCYIKNGKINSFTKMNYEKKLIDFTMLSENEKSLLEEFEVL